MSPIALLSSWMPVVLWASLIFALSSIPSLNSGWGVWDFVLRKGAHIFEYAVLTALIVRAVRRTRSEWVWRRVALVSATAAVLYAASDEFHQSFVPGRGPSVHDVLIDSIGIVLAIFILKKAKIYA